MFCHEFQSHVGVNYVCFVVKWFQSEFFYHTEVDRLIRDVTEEEEDEDKDEDNDDEVMKTVAECRFSCFKYQFSSRGNLIHPSRDSYSKVKYHTALETGLKL